MHHFNYSQLSQNSYTRKDMCNRNIKDLKNIIKASTCTKQSRVYKQRTTKSKQPPRNAILKLCNVVMKPEITYVCETWMMKKQREQKMLILSLTVPTKCTYSAQ